MIIKYNVYYSLNENGPWTLANGTPIASEATNQYSYTISNLKGGTIYWVAVVGGTVDNDTFYPLMSQHIGPLNTGAGDITSVTSLNTAQAKTL